MPARAFYKSREHSHVFFFYIQFYFYVLISSPNLPLYCPLTYPSTVMKITTNYCPVMCLKCIWLITNYNLYPYIRWHNGCVVILRIVFLRCTRKWGLKISSTVASVVAARYSENEKLVHSTYDRWEDYIENNARLNWHWKSNQVNFFKAKSLKFKKILETRRKFSRLCMHALLDTAPREILQTRHKRPIYAKMRWKTVGVQIAL